MKSETSKIRVKPLNSSQTILQIMDGIWPSLSLAEKCHDICGNRQSLAVSSPEAPTNSGLCRKRTFSAPGPTAYHRECSRRMRLACAGSQSYNNLLLPITGSTLPFPIRLLLATVSRAMGLLERLLKGNQRAFTLPANKSDCRKACRRTTAPWRITLSMQSRFGQLSRRENMVETIWSVWHHSQVLQLTACASGRRLLPGGICKGERQKLDPLRQNRVGIHPAAIINTDGTSVLPCSTQLLQNMLQSTSFQLPCLRWPLEGQPQAQDRMSITVLAPARASG